jgi:hypothetical protein
MDRRHLIANERGFALFAFRIRAATDWFLQFDIKHQAGVVATPYQQTSGRRLGFFLAGRSIPKRRSPESLVREEWVRLKSARANDRFGEIWVSATEVRFWPTALELL